MSTLDIYRISDADIVPLQKISYQTFYDTFSAFNSAENMQLYLDEHLTIEKLSKELQDENAAFYFAKIDDAIVGYLKLNFGSSQTEIRQNNMVEIERIYVMTEYHGKNIGQQLYQKAIEIARQNNAESIWLGVWEKNHRAIRFYEKNGFVAFDKHLFKLGNDVQTDIMMKKTLS